MLENNTTFGKYIYGYDPRSGWVVGLVTPDGTIAEVVEGDGSIEFAQRRVEELNASH